MGKVEDNWKKRLGEVSYNRCGSKMQIVRYNGSADVTVKFLDGNNAEVHTIYQNFKSGAVKNPFDRTVCGTGYYGVGKYGIEINEHGNNTGSYLTWHNLIKRCYDCKTLNIQPTYIGCSVCDEWHNFQNFADWYEQNKYKCNGRLHLDKDIIYSENKIYSPDRCLLVPQRINMIFMHKTKTIDADLPNGITRSYLVSGIIRYSSMFIGKQIGTFDSVEKACQEYIDKKIEYIRRITEESKKELPDKVYDALMNWKPDNNIN